MLPEGVEECPRCGAKLHTEDDQAALNMEDIANITLTVLLFAAIPFLAILLVIFICVNSAR
jgi:uncharacterized paraquat-inducible protein A